MFLPNSQEVNNMKVLLRKMLKEIGLNLKWSGTSLQVPFQILNLLLTFDFGIFLFNQLWIKVEEIIENLYNYYLKNKKWWTLLIAFTRYIGYVSLTPVLLKLVLFFFFVLFVCFFFCLFVCLFVCFLFLFWSFDPVVPCTMISHKIFQEVWKLRLHIFIDFVEKHFYFKCLC